MRCPAGGTTPPRLLALSLNSPPSGRASLSGSIPLAEPKSGSVIMWVLGWCLAEPPACAVGGSFILRTSHIRSGVRVQDVCGTLSGMPYVGVYARISRLEDDDRVLGIQRQVADCRHLCDLRGWTVADEYIDPDVSAYQPSVIREAFERMLDDLGHGRIDGIAIYDLDRFARKPADLERAINIYDRLPAVMASVQGDINLQSADGRTMARVMVAFANKSSLDTARRTRRKHLELAQSGKPAGGARPFGWQRDKRTLDLDEAELVQQAAASVVAGVGLHTICRLWHGQGVRTPQGNLWTQVALRRMLTSPRLAGWRVYHKALAYGTDGQPVRGLQEAILNDDTWQAVCAALNPEKRAGVLPARRRYLLAGIVRCECGTRMRGNAEKRWNSHNYLCPSPTDHGGGCGHNAISGTKVDDLIEALLLPDFEQEPDEEPEPDWLGSTRLGEISDKIAELMTAYRANRLSGAVVFPAVEELEAEQAELQRDRAAWLRERMRAVESPSTIVDLWRSGEMTTDQKREIVTKRLHAVVIHRAAKPGGQFDPARVEPIWRGR